MHRVSNTAKNRFFMSFLSSLVADIHASAIESWGGWSHHPHPLSGIPAHGELFRLHHLVEGLDHQLVHTDPDGILGPRPSSASAVSRGSSPTDRPVLPNTFTSR